MVDVIYDSRVEPLLTLGWNDDHWAFEPGRYAQLGLSAEDAPELLRMMSDTRLLDEECPDPEVCAPIHALAALCEFKVSDVIAPAFELLNELEDEDWPTELMLSRFPAFGGEVIEPAAAFLHNPARNCYARGAAAELLQRIAEQQPELRAECVARLAATLELLSADRHVNAAIICSLIKLNATETAALMRRAFDLSLVDESLCGDWPSVEFDLGLTDVQPQRRRYSYIFDDSDSFAYGMTPDERAALKLQRKKQADAAAREKKKAKLAKKQKKRNR